jgi:hypothetical protein
MARERIVGTVLGIHVGTQDILVQIELEIMFFQFLKFSKNFNPHKPRRVLNVCLLQKVLLQPILLVQ